MAFFKFRKAAGEPSAPAPAPESVDALRRRARYRLAGAAILVLAGVIGFPLLFDNQPRPIAVDIPIDIPDKAKVKPLALTPAPEASKPTEVAQPVTLPAVAAPQAAASNTTNSAQTAAKESKPQSKEQPKEEVIISTSKPAAAKAEDKPTAKTDSKAETKATAKSSEKAAEKTADKSTDKAATGRFIVQFGAFTDSARAHEARVKVEKTGLKTYAQVAETADGKKIRVRVGPFEKRSDAEKAAEKIKKLDLPAAILGL